MKFQSFCLLTILGFTGCQTPVPLAPPPGDGIVDREAIYHELQSVPVPVPRTTPFDADDRQRDAYLMGFMKGWDMTIADDHGDYDYFGATYLPEDLGPAWKAGHHAGSDLAKPLEEAKHQAAFEKWFKKKKQQMGE